MDDSGLTDFQLLVALRFADAWSWFLHTRQILYVAILVNLKTVNLTGGKVAFNVPEVTTATFGKQNVVG